jgi:two-component system alkaline phosphatase synthesis response regulator PhoP
MRPCIVINLIGKVLIFDDDPDILEICRFVLEAKGLEVQTRTVNTHALKDINSFNPDLIMMDNWIPDVRGVESILQLKNDPASRAIPIILFTASKHAQELAQQAGADGWIEKPFNIKLLEDVVQRLLDKRD